MATYTVGPNDAGVGAWTMTASTADTVNFSGNVDRVRIISDGAADIYITTDGTTPTVPTAGASTRCTRIPAGTIGALDVSASWATDVVKLISSGTPKVSVERAM